MYVQGGGDFSTEKKKKKKKNLDFIFIPNCPDLMGRRESERWDEAYGSDAVYRLLNLSEEAYQHTAAEPPCLAF